MYIKRQKVRRGGREYVYLRLVESFRNDEGKVRHRTVVTLGREDELKASGQLDRLAGSFARLDPPPLGTRREVGPLLLVRAYLRRLGIVDIVDRAVPMRGRALLTHGEVIEALIVNRLCAPAPLYDVAGWASSAAVQELFDTPSGLLNDDRLGRALEALAPVAEHVRGEAALAAIDAFDVDVAQLHVDLTCLRFAGAYPDSTLVAKGWGPDRKVARQVRALQAVTREGVPLYVRAHPGNAGEAGAMTDAMEQLRRICPPGLVVVADSALGHLGNLCAADRSGIKFVVPLRADTGFAQFFLDHVGHDALRPLRYVSQRQEHLPPGQRTRYRGALRDWDVTDPATRQPHRLRVAFIHSSEEHASVADARQRALTKAETALTKIRNGLGGRYYNTLDQVDTRVANILHPKIASLLKVTTGTDQRGRPTIAWARDQDAIDTAATTDGIYALATNLEGTDLRAVHVLRRYKQQQIVERRNRDAKSTLKVRPVFLHNDDRIDALVSIVGLALLIFGLIEADLRHAIAPATHLPGLLPEDRAAIPTGRSTLAAFDHLAATYTATGIVLDRLTPTQRTILGLLDIPLPWPEQQDLDPKRCGKRG
ncbi:MAG TPA: IS1634 family transposase [Nitriliruptorales bacterium]